MAATMPRVKVLSSMVFVFLFIYCLIAGLWIRKHSGSSRTTFNNGYQCYSTHWIILAKYTSDHTLSCAVTSSGWTILYHEKPDIPKSLGIVIQTSPAPFRFDTANTNNPLFLIVRYGAQVIYQVDDLAATVPNLINKTFEYHLQATGKGLFNPYRHFGPPSLRPRGYSSLSVNQSNISYHISEEQSPKIIHIITGRHDYHVTSGNELNVTFDTRAPPVFVTSGLWGPIIGRNTLFLNQTLWALVKPITMSVTEANIIGGYWAQRLLWEINGKFGFLASDIYQQSGHVSTDSNKPSRKFVNQLLSFLEDWTCEKNVTFFHCAKKLSKDMADKVFWNRKDYLHIESWLDSLRSVGYPEPLRKKTKIPQKPKNQVMFFHPTEQKHPDNSTVTLTSGIRQVLTSTCSNTSITFSNLVSVRKFDIVLIVFFSFPYYNNIPQLELMYTNIVHKIVYCGPNMTSFKTASQNFTTMVTFVEIVENKGFSSYRCLPAVMKMNFKTRGYLFLADDTLLNTWNLHQLPVHRPWLFELTTVYRNKPKPGWTWWKEDVGQKALCASFETLQTMSKDNPGFKFRIGSFLKTLERNTGSVHGAMIGESDIVYIPEQYSESTIFFLDLFVSKSLFLEIALPTLVAGLVPKNEVYYIKGQYFWYDGKRDKVQELFQPDHIFMHPVKLSKIKKSLNNFFCDSVFPLIFQNRTQTQ